MLKVSFVVLALTVGQQPRETERREMSFEACVSAVRSHHDRLVRRPPPRGRGTLAGCETSTPEPQTDVHRAEPLG